MKLKSPKQPEMLSLVDRFREREDEIRKLRDEKDAQARERVRLFSVANMVLEGQLKQKLAQADKLKIEYVELKIKLEGEIEQTIKGSTIVEDDVKSGKVSLHEFRQVGKKNEQVAIESRAKVASELEKPRTIIRNLGLEILELKKQILQNKVSIERDIVFAAENFFAGLKSMVKELEDRGVHSMGLSYAHENLKAVKQDLLYTKGYPGVRRWDGLTSINQVEELAFNPIVSEKHLPELFKTIEELRGVSFSKVAISYYVQEFAGTAAGTFVYFAI